MKNQKAENESLKTEVGRLNDELFTLKNNIAQGEYRHELKLANKQDGDSTVARGKIASGLKKLIESN